MKIIRVQPIKSENPILVVDCFVEKGYVQGARGSLP